MQPEVHYTQPRLVLGNDIIRVPVSAASSDFSGADVSKHLEQEHVAESGTFWTMASDASQFTRPQVICVLCV